jgi:transcriptional regulator with XRE-family HTH domain
MTGDFSAELRRLRAEHGLSVRELAALVHHGKSYVHELETGRKPPTTDVARRLDDTLGTGGLLAATLRPPTVDDGEPEIEAMELARRVTASDVSHGTLDRLELATDRPGDGVRRHAAGRAAAARPPAPRVRHVAR